MTILEYKNYDINPVNRSISGFLRPSQDAIDLLLDNRDKKIGFVQDFLPFFLETTIYDDDNGVNSSTYSTSFLYNVSDSYLTGLKGLIDKVDNTDLAVGSPFKKASDWLQFQRINIRGRLDTIIKNLDSEKPDLAILPYPFGSFIMLSPEIDENYEFFIDKSVHNDSYKPKDFMQLYDKPERDGAFGLEFNNRFLKLKLGNTFSKVRPSLVGNANYFDPNLNPLEMSSGYFEVYPEQKIDDSYRGHFKGTIKTLFGDMSMDGEMHDRSIEMNIRYDKGWNFSINDGVSMPLNMQRISKNSFRGGTFYMEIVR